MAVRVDRVRQDARRQNLIPGNGGRDRGCGVGGRGGVVAAVDGDGEDARAGGPVVVDDRAGEDILQAFPDAQFLYRAQRVVQDIRVGAVGVEGQGAVQPCLGRQRLVGRRVVGVRVLRRRQSACQRQIRTHKGRRGQTHRRGIVGSVDGHGQGIRTDRAVVVDDLIGYGVGQGLADAQGLYGRQRVVEHVDVVSAGGQGERPIRPDLCRQRHEADRVVYVDVLGGGKRARGGESQILGDGGGCGRHCGRFVAAVDGHGQGAASRKAVLILCLTQEYVLKRIPHAQLPHSIEAAVQSIGIRAVGVEGERAVQPRLSREGREADGVMGIGIAGDQRPRRRDGSAHADGCGLRPQHRRVVRTIDGDGQGACAGTALVVRNAVGDGVGQAFPLPEPAYIRGVGVERIDVPAVGVEAQGAVPARQCGGCEGYGIVDVGIARAGQHAGYVRRVFGDDGGGRGHCGRIVDPVDGDGQRAGCRAAVPVDDAVGEGVGERFPQPKALHGGL